MSDSDSLNSFAQGDEAEEKLLGRGHRHQNQKRGLFLTYTQLILLVVSLVLVYPAVLSLLWMTGPIDRICSMRTSQWSPVLKAVDTTYSERRLNGSVYHASKYRGPAGRETDDAWNGLGVNYSFAVLDPAQASKAGIEKSQLQVADKYGGGYVVNLEVVHQLHCLDILRKALHWNYDYYIQEAEGSFNGTEKQVQTHIGSCGGLRAGLKNVSPFNTMVVSSKAYLDVPEWKTDSVKIFAFKTMAACSRLCAEFRTCHCLDMLREDLMCSSDVGLVGLSWFNISGEAMPLPKFDTKHQCRNFEAIREWARTEQVIDPPDDYFRQPQPDEIQDGRP